MKHNFSTSGALRARTRALCALTLALFTSAIASAQTWGTENNTNYASYQSSIANGVTMTVTSPVDGKRQVILKGVWTNNLTCWCTLIVNGSESITTIDDIPRGTYQINSSGTVGTALASQGISGSDIIGSGGCYHGSNTPSSSQGNWFHTMTGYVIVADNNTDAHHNLIFMHSATFHSNVQDEGKCDFKVHWSGSASADFSVYKFIQDAPTVTGGAGTATRRNQNNLDKAGRLGDSYYITVTATPDEGYSFVKWQDDLGNDVGTDNPMTFHAWGPKNVVAVLAAAAPATPTYTITWVDGNGDEIYHETVTEGDVPAFDNRTTPTKNQTPQYTYTFNNTWSPTPYAADKDQTYTAQFNQTTRQYTITVTSAGHGTVTGGGTYDYGTSVPLTATPDTYYTFSSWTDAGAQNHNVTVTGTATYTASFTLNTSSTLEINDNENTTYYSTILAAYNGTPMDIQLNRRFYAGMWNTVCFPFDLTAVQRSSSGMSAATFYTLSSVTGDAAEGLDFNVTAITTETMTARTPYLVQFTGADINNPTFEDVTLAANAFTNNTTGTNVGETHFFGTVHPTSLEIGENSGYLFLGQNNSLYWPNVNNDIRAFRAYFYSGNSTVQAVRPRARIVVKEQTATGNSGISGNSGTSGESARKYLHNGVLVIERDGVKYNAVGQPIE